MDYWIAQVLNGLSFGMLLYMLAAGLTLTLGVMRLINLTHGSFYLVGAYAAMQVGSASDNFALGAIGATVIVLILGLAVYPLLRMAGEDHLRQALLTFGLLFIVADLCLMIFGGAPELGPKPSFTTGAIDIFGVVYPTYRLSVIAVGAIVVIALETLQRRTMFGALVRAVVDDRDMAEGLGRNARMVSFVTFAVGAALAGFGGALGGSLLGAAPGVDVEVLLFGLIIVIIGGMGSTTGALIGAISVGLLDTIGRAILPQLGASLIFLLMLLTLVFRPTGLLGREA